MRNMVIKIDARRLTRFLITGVGAAVVEYFFFILLQTISKSTNIFVHQTISFLCGFAISFILNKKWVFKSDSSKKDELIKYSILAIINLVLSNILIVTLVSIVGVAPWFAKLVVMTSVAIWNYIIYQRIIFKKEVMH
jgi:putative flippase GtrA